jgi:hypothetical protein
MNPAATPPRSALTATVTLDLVTTRTLIRALALLGIKWSPVPLEQIARTSEEGLYAWVAGRGHEHTNPLDSPVTYIGIGKSRSGGLRGRLLVEWNLICDSAAHAHGRAMHRLQGRPLGGPVRQMSGVDASVIETIRTSEWEQKESGIRQLQAWLSASRPDVLSKAEQLCIRTAIHIGDTPPPLNSQYAGAWGSYAAYDWGGWAVAQRLANPRPNQRPLRSRLGANYQHHLGNGLQSVSGARETGR